jgi:hypothetical protein
MDFAILKLAHVCHVLWVFMGIIVTKNAQIIVIFHLGEIVASKMEIVKIVLKDFMDLTAGMLVQIIALTDAIIHQENALLVKKVSMEKLVRLLVLLAVI